MPEQDDGSVGTLELFFDLVFVSAMSQVTSLMVGDISWIGFGHGSLALAAIWWAWVCFAWLTQTSDEAGPLIRTLTFLAMTAMLIAAIALPKAFGQHHRFTVSGVAVAHRWPHRLRRPDHLRNGRLECPAVLFRRAAREPSWASPRPPNSG